jgi:hypothetical protein
MVSSIHLAPDSTASRARPLLERIFHASAFTGLPLSHVDTTIGLVTAFGLAEIFFIENSGVANVESSRNFLLLSMGLFFKLIELSYGNYD